MNSEFVIYATRESLKLLILIVTPTLLIPMLLGLVISILQAITSVQDQLLNFLPKLLVMLIMIMFGTPYALQLLGNFLNDVLTRLLEYI